MTQRYKITRTGRRATKLIVQLSAGKKVLQPTGPHVWNLSPADLEIVRALPCVHVVPIDSPAPPAAKKPGKSSKTGDVVRKSTKGKKKGGKKG